MMDKIVTRGLKAVFYLSFLQGAVQLYSMEAARGALPGAANPNDPNRPQVGEHIAQVYNVVEPAIRNNINAMVLGEREALQNALDAVNISLANARGVERERLLARRAQLEDQLFAVARRHGGLLENAHQAAVNIGAEYARFILDRGREEFSRQTQFGNTAINARENRAGMVQASRDRFADITNWVRGNPKYILGMTAGLTIASYGTYKGLQIAAHRFEKETPRLAQETSLLSTKEQMLNWLTGKPQKEANIKDVILPEEDERRVEEIVAAMQYSVQNGAYLKNGLFWGPPGTGKTFLLERIARSSGMDYLLVAGPDAFAYSVEEGIIEWNKVFDRAENHPRPVMIVIDECEVILGDRKDPANQSDKKQAYLNLILTRFGTENRKRCVFAICNLPERLDEAFLSRCDIQMYVGVPAVPQRKQLIKKYFTKYLIKAEHLVHEVVATVTGFFNNLFSSPPPPPTPLKFEQGLLKDNEMSPQLIDEISDKLEGHDFVGRDISKMMLMIESTAHSTKDSMVTRAIIDRVIKTKIHEKRVAREGFKRAPSQADKKPTQTSAAA